MASVFISYRRDDSRDLCQHLAAKLIVRLGKRNVFFDIDSIAGGDVFPQRLADALHSCDVVLVLIGPRWLSITDEYGRPRLANPEDFVRREVEQVILSGKTILPVLVHGATMPPPAALPPSLQQLTSWTPLMVQDGPTVQQELERVAMLAQRTALAAELRQMPRIAFPWLTAIVALGALFVPMLFLGEGVASLRSFAIFFVCGSLAFFVIAISLALFSAIQRKLWAWFALILLLFFLELLSSFVTPNALQTPDAVPLAFFLVLLLIMIMFSISGPRLSQRWALLRLRQVK